MAYIDRDYHRLLNKILRDGYVYEDPNRKNVYRTEILSYTIRHQFKDGFPLVSTRALNYNNIITELLWFLKGDTNIKYLVNKGCNIWNKDAYKYYLKKNNTDLESMNIKEFIETIRVMKDTDLLKPWFSNGYVLGDLGPVYGHQWRHAEGGDQIKRLVENMINFPLATDHIVDSWNVKDLADMALPPCHFGFQILVRPLTVSERFHATPGSNLKDVNVFIENAHVTYLDEIGATKYGFELHWTQRSVDTFLGLPYNIASYASLALILEKLTGYKALGIQGNLNKVHLYDNSLRPASDQLRNDQYRYNECKLMFPEDEEDPNGFDFNLRMGYLRGHLTLDDFIKKMKTTWFNIEGYDSYPQINVPMLERDE
jgi:thymidylate synthase